MAGSKCVLISSRKVAIIFTFVSLLVLAKSSVSLASVPSPPFEDPYVVQSFSLLELQAGRRSDDLASELSKTGMIAVTFVDGNDNSMGPSFSATRREAFRGLCGCMQPPSSDILSIDNSDRTLLSDGITTRTSIATATMSATPLPLPAEQIERVCGSYTPQAMEALRDHVSFATDAFIVSLDKLIRQSVRSSDAIKSPPDFSLLRNIQGTEFTSVKSIVDTSRNLEHFHVYSKTKLDKSSSNAFEDYIDMALRTHIDAGLFLSFVPAYSCDDDDKNDSSFYVNVDGTIKPAVFPQRSVIIMLGAGAVHWLRLPEVLPLRATKHAVKMREGDTRAWYGMMHLVPENAVIQESPQVATFAEMRKFMFVSGAARRYGDADPLASVVDTRMSIGCGSTSADRNKGPNNSSYENRSGASRNSRFERRRLEMVPDASYCNNSTNFYCWMSCLDVPDYENAAQHVKKGESLYCLDTTTLYRSGGNVSRAVIPCDDPQTGAAGGSMNTDCIGEWQPTAKGIPAQVVIFNSTPQTQADTEPYCYGATSMYMDGFQWHGTACVVYLFPTWVISSAGKMVLACIGTFLLAMFLEGIIFSRRILLRRFAKGPEKLVVSTLVYGAQLTLGYFIMLVVMTYSGPLFLSVILGLMLGHFTFLFIGGRENSYVSEGEGSTPCCQNDVGSQSIRLGAKEASYGPTSHSSQTDQEEIKLPLAGKVDVVEGGALPVLVDGAAGDTPSCCCSVDIENI